MTRGVIKKLCCYPGCNKLFAGSRSRFCELHQKKVDKERVDRRGINRWTPNEKPNPFYFRKEWKRARLGYIAANPVCERCKVNLAEEVHHIQPLRDFADLAYDWENLEALCKRCHVRETIREIQERRRNK